MKIDSTTWCAPENQAGKYLADILSNIGDDKLPEKVSTYFHRFQNRMNALNGMEKGMRVFYLDLLVKKTKAEIESNIQYEKVKTLMQNIITGFYRVEMSKIYPNKNK
jgi:hypothetical protein